MPRYSYDAVINNNTNGVLKFLYCCKGTDNNPSGWDAEKGKLYHGEMTHQDSEIPKGQSRTFSAKSTGDTIQGTLVFEASSGEVVWIYFHVPDLEKRHLQSRTISIEINKSKGDHHPKAVYDVQPCKPLELITYNTHLFGSSNLDKTIPQAFSEKARRALFEDDARRSLIAEKIVTENADVVILQEVWGEKNHQNIIERVVQKYPFVCFVDENQPSTIYNLSFAAAALTVWAFQGPLTAISGIFSGKALQPSDMIGNGLLLLSKFPIIAVDYLNYRKVEGEDTSARKAVISAVLRVSPESDASKQLRLIYTHMPTKKELHRENIDDVVEVIGRGKQSTIVAGDFNIGRSTYENSFSPIKDLGYKDSYVAVHGVVTDENIQKACTTDINRNSLDSKVRPGVTGEPDRIDYVFTSGAGNAHLSLEPLQVAVDHDTWKYQNDDGLSDLSDHYPLKSTIKIIWK
ncbi:endonuclease/exonuclease/phosphatase family protein [Marinobacter mobilis]|uniref:Endonuclease/Exonuclease/phosphatase family protein n=1 Tax=Marinobacter mobilis TaxID=488533 RepID=A0A1H3D432_9GAMM|nr:endonuclease/exonuclease/phosphatase family protein [Marinobacter mobilis]SDX60888.1 Endonuclease/Exonuclease/phosphatase family protein [Marinobacter mobilis]